ncbi:MAG: hypothetical protein HY736_16305 [Verrucomicrobia bacterium]|nr:hypothetical protein [Verrucomicrobiota bacterium]
MRTKTISWPAPVCRLLGVFAGLAVLVVAHAGELNVGWASIDLTPELSRDRQAVMGGLLIPRFSSEVRSRVTATALALEGLDAAGARTQAVLVNLACPSQTESQALYISADFWDAVRTRLRTWRRRPGRTGAPEA